MVIFLSDTKYFLGNFNYNYLSFTVLLFLRSENNYQLTPRLVERKREAFV